MASKTISSRKRSYNNGDKINEANEDPQSKHPKILQQEKVPVS